MMSNLVSDSETSASLSFASTTGQSDDETSSVEAPDSVKPTVEKLSAAEVARILTANPLFCNHYFEVRPSTVAGLGVYATRHLQRGDIILIEEPLFISNEYRLFEDFEGLDGDTKHVALGLHANEHLKEGTHEVKAVWSTNCFATRSSSSGLFAVAARFNHACHPAHNVDYVFDKEQGSMVVTVRAESVAAGDELTICYGADRTPQILYL